MTPPVIRAAAHRGVHRPASVGAERHGTEQGIVRRTPGRVRRLLVAAAVALVVVEGVLVAPQVGRAVTALSAADVYWLVAAGLATAASMSMFARGRRRLLAAADVGAPAGGMLVAVYVANAFHLTLPGGAAFSTAYTYRWMRSRGATPAVATWVLATGGVLATGALLVLGLTGALLIGERGGGVDIALELAGLLLAVTVAYRVLRHPRLVRAACLRVLTALNRLRRRAPRAGAAALDNLLGQLRAMPVRPVDWFAASGYAVLNWAFDIACLVACTAALHVSGLTVPLVLVAYTAGMATSGLSPLPGGIGLVDGTLVLALVAGGVPAASAIPVVLLYRLISVLGVVAVGWILYACGGEKALTTTQLPSGEIPIVRGHDHRRACGSTPAGASPDVSSAPAQDQPPATRLPV